MSQHEKVYALRALGQLMSVLSTKEATTEKKIDVRGGKAGWKVRRSAGVERRKRGPMFQKIEQLDPCRARGLEPLGLNAFEHHGRRQGRLSTTLCSSHSFLGESSFHTVLKRTTCRVWFCFLILEQKWKRHPSCLCLDITFWLRDAKMPPWQVPGARVY